jgi:Flp pilus assembly protein TadD
LRVSDSTQATDGSAAERHNQTTRLLADAQAAIAAGEWARAAEHLHEALAIVPGHAEATARLALVRERAGRQPADAGHETPLVVWVLLVIGVVLGALAAIAAGVWVAS